jgi:hypothetical protein
MLGSYWADHYVIQYWSDGGLFVILRPRRGGLVAIHRVRDYVFYVWEPDCRKVWPALWPEPETPEALRGLGAWKITVHAELRHLGSKRVRDLHNSRQLTPHLEQLCTAKGTPLPKHRGDLYTMIRAFSE